MTDWAWRLGGLLCEVREACYMPRGYGLVRRYSNRRVAVTAPIPLNVVLRAGWIVYDWLRVPWRGPSRAELEEKIEEQSLEIYRLRKIVDRVVVIDLDGRP